MPMVALTGLESLLWAAEGQAAGLRNATVLVLGGSASDDGSKESGGGGGGGGVGTKARNLFGDQGTQEGVKSKVFWLSCP